MRSLPLWIILLVLVFPAIRIGCGQTIDGGNPLTGEAEREYEVLAAKINNEIQKACAAIALQEDATFTDKKKLAAAKVALKKAEARYRATLMIYLRGVTKDLKTDAARETLDTAYREADGYTDRYLEDLHQEVVDLNLDDGRSERKVQQWGEAEGRMRAALIETNSIVEALAQVAPMDYTIGLMTGVNGVNRNASRLVRLARRIGDIDTNDPNVSVGGDQDFKKWLLLRHQRALIDSFRHIAMHGLMVDPATLRPLSGPIRTKVAGRSLEFLIDRLKIEHHFNTSRLEHIFAWGTNREDLAKEIAAELLQWKPYQIARYTSPSIVPNTKEYMLATARLIRAEQERLNTWYTVTYLGRDEESTTAFGEVMEGFDSNLDQWFRAGDFDTWDDQSKRSALQGKIRWFMRETDAAADALHAAGTATTLDDLTAAQLKLLRIYGFVDETPDGGHVLVISNEGRLISGMVKRLEKRIDLPGASWLAIISPETIAITAVSVIVPELIGARFLTWAEGAIASKNALAVTRIMTEMSAGAVTDGAIEFMQNGRIDVQRLVKESLLLGGVLQFSGKASEEVVNHALRRLVATEGQSRLTRALRNDRAFREAMEAQLSGVLSLGAETGLTAVYQGIADGADLDFTACLSIAAQSLIGRVVGDQYATGSLTGRQITGEHVLRLLPASLQKHFKAHPEALAHLARSAEASLKRETEAQERYDRIAVDPTSKDVFWSLLRGDLTWAQLKLLYAKDVAGRTEMMAEIKKQRDEFFENIVLEAQLAAHEALTNEFNRRKSELMGEGASERALETLHQEYARETQLINEPLVAPGSGDPTSDIDRSARSNWMRLKLREIYVLRAQRTVGTDPPPSLHAVDVNEYINIFPLIASNRDHVQAMAGKPATEFNFPCKHSEAMEALSLSAAMRHMTSEQRTTFKQNRLRELKLDLKKKKATRETEQRAERLLRDQLTFAEGSLNESQRMIEASAESNAFRMNLPADHPKVLLEARDTLYSERMTALNKEVARLEQMQPADGPDAIFLRAKIERDLSLAMRDGIETYSHPTGLDIVVTEVQAKIKTDADGRPLLDEYGHPIKMKVADRIDDPNFTLAKDLSHYSERDINGILNDQMMFIMEHVNHYNHGHETSYEAGRALGKYIERAFLAMKIKGMDVAAVRKLGKADPKRRLLEFSQALARSKGSPDDLNAVLASFAMRTPRTADQGMLELFRLSELVLPGMKNLAGDAIARRNGLPVITPAVRRRVVFLQRRREKQNEAIERNYGPDALATQLAAEKKQVESEIARLKKELDQLRALAGDHLIKDADALLRLEARYQSMVAFVSSVPTSYSFFSSELRQAENFKKRIDQLKGEKITDPKERDEALASAARGFARRLARLAWLEALLPEMVVERADALKRAAALLPFDSLQLTGPWKSAVNASSILATVAHTGRSVTIEVTWPGLDGDGPQLRIESKRHGDRLVGAWYDLTREPSEYERRHDRTEGRIAGGFEAKLAADGQTFEVTKRTTDHPRLKRGPNGVLWEGVVFSRGAPEEQTPSESWIGQRQTPIPPAANIWERQVGSDNLAPGHGRFALDLRGGDGRWLNLSYDVYRSGTDEWVEYGERGAPVDLPAGTYDVRFPGRSELDVRSLVVGVGGVSSNPPVQLGRTEVFVENADGTRLPVTVLRVRRDGEEITARESLPPGDYEFEFGFAGRRFVQAMSIRAATLSSMVLRPAAIAATGLLADGAEVPVTIYAFTPGDYSTPLRRARPGMTLHLAPGIYDLRLAMRDYADYPLEAIEVDGLEVAAGQQVELTPRWARLKIVRGAHPPEFFAYRAGLDTSSNTGWLGITPQTTELDLAPGPFVFRWGTTDDETRIPFQLEAGQTATINVEMKPER